VATPSENTLSSSITPNNVISDVSLLDDYPNEVSILLDFIDSIF
jgi:hypothetical protein